MPSVLITGSSRGIGRGIALTLAGEGYNIFLNAPKKSDALSELEKIIRDLGVQCHTLIFDIADLSSHEKAIEKACSQMDELVALVNNAGVGVQQRGDLLELSELSFDQQIDVNLKGSFFLTQRLAKRWLVEKTESFRSIVTISSSNAEIVSVERGEYCIAKSGLSMMNKLFAVRLAGEGVNCYEVRPGLIDTDMTRPVKETYDKKIEHGFSPINRWGRVEDVAEVVSTLVQGKMKFATGEVLHPDGGLFINRY